MIDREIVQRIFRQIDLTQNESKVYLAMVESGETRPAGIARCCGLPRQKIYGIIEELMDKGGCILINKKHTEYMPVKPDILFGKAEQEINSLFENSQKLNAQLGEMYRKNLTENRRISDSVTTLVDPVQIAELVVDLISKTKREALCFSVSSQLDPVMKRVDKNRLAQLNEVFCEELERAVEERGIKFYNLTSLSDLNTDLIEARMDAPAELTNFKVRFIDHIYCRMNIYDREEVLLSLSNERTNQYILKSLYIRDKGVAELLANYFYYLFENATKLDDMDVEEMLK